MNVVALELFFMFIIVKEPTGVEFRAQEIPYYSATDCINATGKALDAAKKHGPAVGALCFTLDEIAGFKDPPELPLKRPL